MRKLGVTAINWLIPVIVALLVSCVTTKSSLYKEGLNYLNVQAYDQAVEKLSLALEAKPGDVKIAQDLDWAKKLAAKEHYDLGLDLSEREEVNGALTEFDRARGYQPQNETYQSRYRQEKKKYDEIREGIDGAIALAREKRDWDGALKKLNSITIYESSFPEIEGKIEDVKREASAFHESLSENNLHREDYSGAYDEMDRASRYFEDERIKNKKRARHHLLQSHQAWKRNHYMRAYEEIQKGLEFEPDHLDLKAYEKRFVDQWAGILYNQAIRASNEGEYAVAKERLSLLTSLKPGYLDVEEMLAELQSTLAATYYRQAENLMNAEDRAWVGTALANYLLVREQHNSQFPDIEDKISEAKRLLKKEVELRLSVDFRNRSEEPGAGGYVEDKILTKLRSSGKLKNVNILEREAIDEILREQGLGQGFLDETTNLAVKKIKGIQAAIKGEVLKVSAIETGRNRPTYGSKRYVSGTRMVPNPDYQAAQSRVAHSQQKVLTSQQEMNRAQVEAQKTQAQAQQYAGQGGTVGSLGALTALTSSLAVSGARTKLKNAEKDLREAQDELARTPIQMEEDVYADFRYEIFDLKLDGEAVLSFRMINFTTSEIGPVHTVRKTASISDRYVPGDPGKGIKPDPNNLPEKEKLKGKLLQEAIEEISQNIEVELAKYSTDYYEKGLSAEKDRLKEKALENYMRFIYSAPDLADPRVHHANDFIYEKMGLRLVRKKG